MSKKMKICSKCGKKVVYTETCSCSTKEEYNSTKRKYYDKNKDIIKPLLTKRWKLLRVVIFNRDKHCCQRCLIKYNKINSENLQVHHIKPRVDYPELIFDEKNLVTLCKTCNLQLGTNDKLDFEMNINLETHEYEFHL